MTKYVAIINYRAYEPIISRLLKDKLAARHLLTTRGFIDLDFVWSWTVIYFESLEENILFHCKQYHRKA